MVQGIAASQRPGNPGQPGYRQAGADRVAGPQERPEVGLVLRPQGGRDEVIPALVAAVTPLAGQFPAGPDPDLRAAHQPVSRSRPDGEVCVIGTVLSGAPEPSPVIGITTSVCN